MAEKFRGVLQPRQNRELAVFSLSDTLVCALTLSLARPRALRNSFPSCKKGWEFFIEGHVKKAIMEQNGT